ncbi:SPASM domain-containing protein [Salinispora arenicola]|uniref:SPASM domain-containing protein n=1 Tax=Salinispora arenicola TaxID=168697 RepID=UPI00036DF787|nr:SPASM domain-containing protein [Salinispora arenicola]
MSTGDYSKSSTQDWRSAGDRDDFDRVVEWLGTRPFLVQARLATLGEPFASRHFLDRASWLTRQKGVQFVEFLTNGALLHRRLPKLAETADMSKLSLWITYHQNQISMERLIANARLAQEEFGCFVVVNSLLFPGTEDSVSMLTAAAEDAGLRFNVDLGYDPAVPAHDIDNPTRLIPILSEEDGTGAAHRLGIRPEMLDLTLTAFDDVHRRPCSAGHDYIYISIDGEVYPCSRYYVLKQGRLGNVLEPGFKLSLRADRYQGCAAKRGCCNKEDFLNLAESAAVGTRSPASLGWIDV